MYKERETKGEKKRKVKRARDKEKDWLAVRQINVGRNDGHIVLHEKEIGIFLYGKNR